MKPSLLTVLREAPEALGPFALLIRGQQDQEPMLEILRGETLECQSLADIPLPPQGHVGPWILSLVPFRQLGERGYDCIDDGEPLRLMQVCKVQRVGLHGALHQWPNAPITIRDGHFDIDDNAYAKLVNGIIHREISHGEGSSFVIKRTYQADIEHYSLISALTAFKKLVQRESKAYWTFLVHTGDRTWIGASPERHVALEHGIASMNPISGTYRYPASGATLSGLLEFLDDQKERDELYMVVDEELKMMSAFCKEGAWMIGPRLKMMSRLAHTEYVLEGRSDADPRTILKETLFSPAVTGSPIQNACRVVARYEPQGRGYYAGVLAMFGRSQTSELSLDSTILIRTADINSAGRLQVSVGATIVRHSDPANEALESYAKALAIINAFSQPALQDLEKSPAITSALAQRNAGISKFWLTNFQARSETTQALAGRELLIIDAEDAFSKMLGHQFRALGLSVSIVGVNDRRVQTSNWDLALFGPGPGDPCNVADLRIKSLGKALSHALAIGKPFMAVCLSHQLLCLELKLPVSRLAQPNQGVRADIDYFGEPEKVGFYNTFCARHGSDSLVYHGRHVEVSRNPATKEVHALRGPGFISMQFHPESILTQRGPALLVSALLHITRSDRGNAQAIPDSSLKVLNDERIRLCDC